ncbi:MAG TPA: hypothetical protein EYP10_05040, partial [Armatimonadetes bacterium]|nr:hypothetical protein [Armatimonadota bacterium]
MKYCPLAISIMVSILVAHGATDAFLNRHMPPKVPFPDALDSACISVPKLDDVLEYALILGNGDINGLLYSEGGTLILRITKNDVWDARLDTSNDPPLPTLALLKRLAFGDWENRAWILPPGYKLRGLDSYRAHPYPCPRTCAIARISNLPPKPFWKQIRAQGVHNAWKRRGNVTVMSIEGKAGASNGYAFGPLSIATDEYSHLRVRLSGTKNARVFVELQGANNATIFSSGWLDSPMKSKELTFKLPPGKSISRIILYTWTKDGKRAENRFEAVEFVGKSDTLSINLSTIAPPTCPAKLDIRRAVAHVDGISGGPPKAVVRALAHCNAFLIESSAQVELLPVRTPEIPASACGERNGVKWLHQRIPGDLDWAGMEFAVALATNGNRRAIAVVTSLESSDVIGDAVKLAQSVAMANLSNTIDKHEAIWERFWSVSGIDISDELLCKEWYRNLYFLRCVTKPGVVSPGLFASLIDEHPAWHGDYHTNYNIQQTFWSCFITNHTDLLEPYERLVMNYLPRARWLARRIFNCNGAYFPHVLFAYEPAHPERCRSRNGRQYIHHVWGFTIGVSGFTVQPLWWRYKHEP